MGKPLPSLESQYQAMWLKLREERKQRKRLAKEVQDLRATVEYLQERFFIAKHFIKYLVGVIKENGIDDEFAKDSAKVVSSHIYNEDSWDYWTTNDEED